MTGATTIHTLGGLTIEHAPEYQQPAEDVGQLRAPLETMPNSSFSSSNVHSGLYDYGEMELYLRFLRDGPDAIYRYDGVPAEVWSGLQNAQSKGSYVNEFIAFQYPYSQLTTSNFPERGHGLENDLARRFVTTP